MKGWWNALPVMMRGVKQRQTGRLMNRPRKADEDGAGEEQIDALLELLEYGRGTEGKTRHLM